MRPSVSDVLAKLRSIKMFLGLVAGDHTAPVAADPDVRSGGGRSWRPQVNAGAHRSAAMIPTAIGVIKYRYARLNEIQLTAVFESGALGRQFRQNNTTCTTIYLVRISVSAHVIEP